MEAPRLGKSSESVISLLREDPRVTPIFAAFQRFLYSRATTKSLRQMFDPRRFEAECGAGFGEGGFADAQVDGNRVSHVPSPDNGSRISRIGAALATRRG